ncbi:MAG: CYTH domain-containing protein [Anaerovibrio sp.]|uniref:CYTH domain-containing protein n=1 Tax=Anaerovibrio sp. TaxID=1872532 RepID=UPI0025EA016B|nr:CYTH domain-containing protein [Anaerovibrio sp.]MCR5175937.1 CYTH domain-containing protein [Anaerovibrio sp.]
MGVEIERKFLVDRNKWVPANKGLSIRQGYISDDKDRIVRIRTRGDRGYITIKGANEGLSRLEMEYEIPHIDAANLLDKLCLKPLIEKKRYIEEYQGHIWEIDVFFGDNEGLIVAEVELSAPDEKVELPPWIIREVSDDSRYYNSNLIKNPYTRWTY